MTQKCGIWRRRFIHEQLQPVAQQGHKGGEFARFVLIYENNIGAPKRCLLRYCLQQFVKIPATIRWLNMYRECQMKEHHHRSPMDTEIPGSRLKDVSCKQVRLEKHVEETHTGLKSHAVKETHTGLKSHAVNKKPNRRYFFHNRKRNRTEKVKEQKKRYSFYSLKRKLGKLQKQFA